MGDKGKPDRQLWEAGKSRTSAQAPNEKGKAQGVSISLDLSLPPLRHGGGTIYPTGCVRIEVKVPIRAHELGPLGDSGDPSRFRKRDGAGGLRAGSG